MSFEALGLGKDVLKAVADSGYEEPTPIQAAAIPHVLAGRDVLGIAQTGTGKTASFTLPMIDRLARGRAKARMPRSLILEPTRELAAQVSENFETYGKYHKLDMALLIGGVSFADQEKKLDRGVDVLIATPGRLLDHCERGKVLLTGVQILVIDEADRMLDMGFIPDIEAICKRIPFTRQTLFFSATMPPEIQRLTETFLQNPERCEVAPPASAAATVEQALVKSAPREKRTTLRTLIDREEIVNAIIFCNRKRDVGELLRSLERHGYSAAALHGDMDQFSRMKTLDRFKEGEVKLLVASDVAARGLDIPDVSHVFNFDVPFHAEDYVHRIGRTGRAGREGKAFMIATREDAKNVKAIEDLIGRPISVLGLDGAGGEDDQEPPAAEKSKPQRRQSRGRSKPAGRANKASEPKSARSSGDTRKDGKKPAKPARGSGKKTVASDKGRDKQGRSRNGAKEGGTPTGLGDHVPAFLKRPVKREPA